MSFIRGERQNGLDSAFRGLGVPFCVVAERGRFDTRVITQLRELTETERPDVIWSNSVKSHFLVRWAGLNRSRVWVAFHHGYTTTDTKMQFYNQFDRWSLRVADRVLTSSGAFVRELERSAVCSERILVQHMPIRPFVPVSEERRGRLRADLRLNDRTKVILSVGRLSREKGHVELVKAFPKICELAGSMSLRLVIVGKGPERSKIEKLCRKLALTDSVTLVGHQDDPSPYYGIADIFVLPSHSEGCPNVLLEAMAAGVPIVATAVGGVPEIVTHGQNALLVKKHDGSALACESARLLKDFAARSSLTSSAREIVLRKTPEAYFRSIASVFSGAL
jgi:glycosyltransferase involved in cell wall biosynthesis